MTKHARILSACFLEDAMSSHEVVEQALITVIMYTLSILPNMSAYIHSLEWADFIPDALGQVSGVGRCPNWKSFPLRARRSSYVCWYGSSSSAPKFLVREKQSLRPILQYCWTSPPGILGPLQSLCFCLGAGLQIAWKTQSYLMYASLFEIQTAQKAKPVEWESVGLKIDLLN